MSSYNKTINFLITLESIIVFYVFSLVLPFSIPWQIMLTCFMVSAISRIFMNKRIFKAISFIETLFIRYFIGDIQSIAFVLSQFISGLWIKYLPRQIRFFGLSSKKLANDLDLECDTNTSANCFFVNSTEDLQLLNKKLPRNSKAILLTCEKDMESLFCFQRERILQNSISEEKKVLLICNNKKIVEAILEIYKFASLTILTCNMEIISLDLPAQKIYYQKQISFLEEFDYVIDLFELDPYNYPVYRSILNDVKFETNKYIFSYIKSPVIDIYIMNLYKRIIIAALSQKRGFSLISVECGFLEGSKKFKGELLRANSNKIPMEFTCNFTSISQFVNKLNVALQSPYSMDLSAISSPEITSEEVIKFFSRSLVKNFEISHLKFYLDKFEIHESSLQGIFDSEYSIEDKIINRYFSIIKDEN